MHRDSVDAAACAGRLPLVAVIGSGCEEHRDRAEALGRGLAALGVHLVTGGGRGVMLAVSRGFAGTPGRRGLVLGVLPAAGPADPAPLAGYPNPYVEVPIRTHLHLSGLRGEEPLSRNHIIVLSAEVIVALPGADGTRSEVALAQRYGRPLIAHLSRRTEIPALPSAVRVEPELQRVLEYVRGSTARSVKLSG